MAEIRESQLTNIFIMLASKFYKPYFPYSYSGQTISVCAYFLRRRLQHYTIHTGAHTRKHTERHINI
jgi:hypothetical protein